MHMKKTRFLLPLILVTLWLGACRNHRTPYENNLHLQPSYLAQIDIHNYTTIQWLDTLKDFGTIHEGDSVKLVFRFKNTGKKPLFISNVKNSCGCTVTRFPEKALFEGEEAALTAVFNSSGHPGATRKSILATSNTNNGTEHALVFTGNVLPAATQPAK